MAKRDIEIQTEDGVAKASLFGAGQGRTAGVILYMDAFGLRPALDAIATRLEGEGYAVLVPDLFYRQGAYGPLDAKTAFADEKTAAWLRATMGATTQAMTRRDSGVFLKALGDEGVNGPIGTVGYCFGGGRALTAAASYPDRIAAAASIHGGNIASDAEDSPHRRAAEIKALVYVATAGIDRSFPPEQSARLAEALRSAEVDHIIENYVGMAHGWAVADHGVYDEKGAERHWKRLLALFAETLKA